MKRCDIRVKGIVQGVGFRPFVHRLAREHKISGWVSNDTLGVLIAAEGAKADVESFIAGIETRAPLLARIRSVEVSEKKFEGLSGFSIAKSIDGGERLAFYAPDAAVCDECLAELLDPGNRRYRYPFISCINCGPRFSIINDIPYDRSTTEMKQFLQCPECLAEYRDVNNRRYHSQPNACHACGPTVALLDASGEMVSDNNDDVIDMTAKLLGEGKIVAIKGTGGFHLAVLASSNEAVGNLRSRKRRPFKPFALMARNLEVIRRYAEVNGEEERLLASIERPILLLKRKSGPGISVHVAPGVSTLGFMLPSTAFQHLLFEILGEAVLVMTSANLSDEPIVFRDDDALVRLRGIADFYVTSNREIAAQSDDSVMAVLNGQESFIRRARGYVPVPFNGRDTSLKILAMGGDIKNAFALARKDFVIMSQYLGDMADMRTHEVFRETVRHFIDVFDCEPDMIVSDMHPNYMTKLFADEMAGGTIERVEVQHHHAHIASVMEEHDLDGAVIGIAYDGTGYGPDGTLWGSEILLCDRKDFRRAGHFSPFPLPGGESAIRDVWKVGQSLLYSAFGSGAVPEKFVVPETRAIHEILDRKLNSPLTCSIGRLFDGIAAILDISRSVTSDAEAAQLLEESALTWKGPVTGESVAINEIDGIHVADTSDLVKRIVALIGDRAPRELTAAVFHEMIIATALETVVRVSRVTGEKRIALSGGVFHNTILHSGLRKRLNEKGFTVYEQRNVPVNDGGIALGQIAIARAVVG